MDIMAKELYFICDLCDVLITGLEAFPQHLAIYLQLDASAVAKKMFSVDYDALWKAKETERSFFEKLIQNNGWNINVDVFLKLLRDSFQEIPGVREIYRALGNKYNMILVSVNIPEWVTYMEEKFAYEKLFPAGIFYSYDIGYTKREAECFEYVLNYYQIKPDQVVYIDDSNRCIDVATGLGIRGIVFENAAQLREALAVYLDA